MAKKTVEEIRNQLSKESFEDVYSEHFAGKPSDDQLTLLKDVFKERDESWSELNKMASYYLIEWIKEVEQSGYWNSGDENIKIDLTYLPTFIEFYLNIHYEENGLVSVHGMAGLFGTNGLFMENYQSAYSTLYKFEKQLIKKKLFLKNDEFLLEQLNEKRKNVKYFEDLYMDLIYELQEGSRIIGIMLEEGKEINEDVFYNDYYLSIHDKYISKLEKIIIKLIAIDTDSDKLKKLLKYRDYLHALKNPKSSNKLINQFIQQIEIENDWVSFPINIEDQKKFVLISELGIIEHLKQYTINNKGKSKDVKMYPLLNMITGIHPKYIKRMMASSKEKKNKDVRNPFRNLEIMSEVKEIILSLKSN